MVEELCGEDSSKKRREGPLAGPLNKYGGFQDLEAAMLLARKPTVGRTPWTYTDVVKANPSVKFLASTHLAMPLSEIGHVYSHYTGSAEKAEVDEALALAPSGKDAMFLAPVANNANITKRAAKLLEPPCYDYKSQADWPDVVNAVDEWCANTFIECSTFDHAQIMLDLPTDTSPGKVFKAVGAKTKADVYGWKGFQELLDHCDMDLPPLEQHIPVFSCAPKLDELLPAKGCPVGNEIVGNKIRLIFPAEPEFVYLEKKFFGAQNSALMHASPSAYGLNVYSGGFAQVYGELHSPSGKGDLLFLEWDVSGYDSRFPHMDEVCRLRLKYMGTLTKKERGQLKWVVQHMVNSVCLFPDGTLYLFKYGNRSGLLCTTTNNIIGHLFPYSMIHGRLTGSYAIVRKDRKGYVYGDDLIAALLALFPVEVVAEIACSVFKLFGWTLDPCVVVKNLIGRAFLGAKFGLYRGVVVPHYNLDKLMTSVVAGRRLPPDAYAAKLVSICLMMSIQDTRHFEVVFRLLVSHCRMCVAKAPTPVTQAICRQAQDGILCRDLFFSYVSGRESGSVLLDSLVGKACAGRECPIGAGVEVQNKDLVVNMPQATKKKAKNAKKNAKRKQKRQANQRASKRKAAGVRLGPKLPAGFSRQRQLAGMGQSYNRSVPLGRRELTLTEDEYIAEVVGPATGANFANTAYQVNVGNTTTFPWLSTIAKQFEKYHFDFLEFYYKRQVSEFATAGTTGKVIIMFDGDALDAPPASKKQMEDTDPHCDGMPCTNMALQVPKFMLDKFTDGFFVRPGGLPGGGDIKTYDIGTLNIATQALAANTATVGELHVRYRVRLMIPVLESTTTAPNNFQVSQLVSNANEALATTTPYTMLFADTTVADGFVNGLGVVNTSGSVVPPAGNYLVDATAFFTNTGNGTVFAVAIQKNGSNVFAWGSSQLSLPSAANAGVTLSQTAYVTCNGTDTIKVVAETVFSTGASTVNGSLRIAAI